MKTIVFIGFPGVSLAAKLRIQVILNHLDSCRVLVFRLHHLKMTYTNELRANANATFNLRIIPIAKQAE
jgi:hypothetical protein